MTRSIFVRNTQLTNKVGLITTKDAKDAKNESSLTPTSPNGRGSFQSAALNTFNFQALGHEVGEGKGKGYRIETLGDDGKCVKLEAEPWPFPKWNPTQRYPL